MRALLESYTSLNAAPKVELVERYLRDYHGVKIGEKGNADPVSSSSSAEGTTGSKSALKRKGSTEVTKKSAIQQQREKLEVSYHIMYQTFHYLHSMIKKHLKTKCLHPHPQCRCLRN